MLREESTHGQCGTFASSARPVHGRECTCFCPSIPQLCSRIVKKYLETGSVENKPKPGGPSKLTSRAKGMIVSAGLKARTRRKKLYISEVNRKRRLEFAMKYKNKPMDFWEKVTFFYESKLEIFTPPSIRKIWRKNKTALESKNVLPTLKYGGGNVMVWGCVANSGADSAKKLSMENTFIFRQDNDPKHTAIVTKTWLLYYAPRRLETSPQSPDLNPIENL
ncbi:transposable element Tcb2 transposase [Trichonephila clavipes]|uniref:Transposable element Tcb2 transposase n=1 Tax=Trichonephila clavipes TaxID=2585209 RepID=A0A8X6R884_TRICX|nr:transposable element Tcb2 transposase [Trichonephila clavipes]